MTEDDEVVIVFLMTVTMLGFSEKHHRPTTSARFSNATTVNPSSSMCLHDIRPDQPTPITITSVKFLFSLRHFVFSYRGERNC